MPSPNVMSLAIGRLAGKNAGVPPDKIGKSGPKKPKSATKKALQKLADGESKNTK